MSIYEKRDYYQTFLDEQKISLDNHFEISPLETQLNLKWRWEAIVKWADQNRDNAIHKSITPIRPFVSDESMRESVMSMWAGYSEHNTQEWNWGFKSDAILKDFIGEKAFATMGLDMQTSMVRLLQYDPGQMLPLHTDSYNGFKDRYGDGNITRWFIAVTPWDWGHFLQVHDNLISKYDSGYALQIPEGVYHLSGNAGINPKYTFTVTGFIK